MSPTREATARVGIDAHVLTGKRQGSRTYLEGLLAELGAMAPPVRFVLYSFDPAATAAQFPGPGFEHRALPRVPAAVRLLWSWNRIMARDRLDGLVTQYISPPFGRGAQFVVIHDILFETHPAFFPALMRWRLRLLCRRSARRAAAVFAGSDYAARTIAKTYRVPAERIVMTPYAAPVPVPPEDGFALPLKPYFLCVGRIEPRKNLDIVLTASAALRDGGTRLVVVGAPDFRAGATVARLRSLPGVVHVEQASPAALSALYRHAVALVFPSLGEGFGLPVLEALAAGAPVIASNATAIPEAGGDLARYFDPLAPDAAAVLAGLMSQAAAAPCPPDKQAVARHLSHFDAGTAARAFAGTIAQKLERRRGG